MGHAARGGGRGRDADRGDRRPSGDRDGARAAAGDAWQHRAAVAGPGSLTRPMHTQQTPTGVLAALEQVVGADHVLAPPPAHYLSDETGRGLRGTALAALLP